MVARRDRLSWLMNDEESVRSKNARNNQAELLPACGVGRRLDGCHIGCGVQGMTRYITPNNKADCSPVSRTKQVSPKIMGPITKAGTNGEVCCGDLEENVAVSHRGVMAELWHAEASNQRHRGFQLIADGAIPRLWKSIREGACSCRPSAPKV